MRDALVEPGMNRKEKTEVVTRVEDASSEFEVSKKNAAESGRRSEYRTAIEASTARILRIALARGPVDSDPEAA